MDKPESQPAGDGSARPRVEIVGEPAAITKRFQETVASSLAGNPAVISQFQDQVAKSITGDLSKRFGAAGIYAPATAALAKSISGSLTALEVNREARMKALTASVRGLRPVELPKLDNVEPIATRVKPIEFERIRSVEDIRLEQLTNAVNQQTEVARNQHEALLALDGAMEARHAEAEMHADERAARSDNRQAWSVTFAGLAALIVVIELFFR
jgi:hypothetical protein